MVQWSFNHDRKSIIQFDLQFDLQRDRIKSQYQTNQKFKQKVKRLAPRTAVLWKVERMLSKYRVWGQVPSALVQCLSSWALL